MKYLFYLFYGMKFAVSMREIPACAVGEICGAARDLGLVPGRKVWYTEFTKTILPGGARRRCRDTRRRHDYVL